MGDQVADPDRQAEADLHQRPRQVDGDHRDVLLFENEWSIRLASENNAGLELAETASRVVYE